MYRRSRRARKTAYRKPRFDNRKTKKGHLAPSVQHKLDSHVRLVEKLKKIMPVTCIIVETASFDIQKLNNLNIQNKQYQQGEQTGFFNLREYILYRDNHKCQTVLCKTSRSKENQILHVHHLGYWKQDRTNRPANLISVCHFCHTAKNHQPGGILHGWEPNLKSTFNFKPETLMSSIRSRLLVQLQADETFGYTTKSNRISNCIEKTHVNDAFVIAGGDNTFERSNVLYGKQLRRNNRSLEKFYDAKYIDSRDGLIKTGKELSCNRTTRNKNLSGENWKVFRKQCVSKGRVQIKRTRYTLQPETTFKFENRVYKVQGVQNKGAYVKLREYSKPVKCSLVKVIKYRTGFIYSTKLKLNSRQITSG